MTIYTVHVPDEAPDLVTQADRTTFLREGFSFWAFLLGPIYLLWNRLWIAAAVWFVAIAALIAVAVLLHPPAISVVLLAALMHLFLGVEAHDFRRWGLARRGFQMTDLISASEIEEAETVFFNRQPMKPAPQRTPHRFAPIPTTPDVIGMFPDGSGA